MKFPRMMLFTMATFLRFSTVTPWASAQSIDLPPRQTPPSLTQESCESSGGSYETTSDFPEENFVCTCPQGTVLESDSCLEPFAAIQRAEERSCGNLGGVWVFEGISGRCDCPAPKQWVAEYCLAVARVDNVLVRPSVE